MTRPRLTSKVVRGLRQIASRTRADIESGEASSYDKSNGGPGTDEAETALEYLYALIEWHDARKREGGV